MELKDFIGKEVVDEETGIGYWLYEITATAVVVQQQKPDRRGHRKWFSFSTQNGDPFTKGYLRFSTPSLTASFQRIYAAYCQSEEGRIESYHDWLQRE